MKNNNETDEEREIDCIVLNIDPIGVVFFPELIIIAK